MFPPIIHGSFGMSDSQPPAGREEHHGKVSLERSYILSHSWRANLYNVPKYRQVAEPLKDIDVRAHDLSVTPQMILQDQAKNAPKMKKHEDSSP